jgi:hypothetical protein
MGVQHLVSQKLVKVKLLRQFNRSWRIWQGVKELSEGLLGRVVLVTRTNLPSFAGKIIEANSSEITVQILGEKLPEIVLAEDLEDGQSQVRFVI